MARCSSLSRRAQGVSPLNIPFAMVSVVNSDNNQHAYDENLRMGDYVSGMRSMLGMLSTPYPGGGLTKNLLVWIINGLAGPCEHYNPPHP